MFDVGQIVRFQLDDTEKPGWARVKILSRVAGTLNLPTFRIEVVEVVEKSPIRRVRPGTRLTAAAIDLSGSARMVAEDGVHASNGN